jgi:hypothetical protein
MWRLYLNHFSWARNPDEPSSLLVVIESDFNDERHQGTTVDEVVRRFVIEMFPVVATRVNDPN